MQTFEIFTFNRAINCQTYFFPQQTLRSIQNLLCWTISRFVSVQILSSSACSCVSIIGIFSLVGFHKTKQRNLETCVHFININHFLSFFVIYLSNNVVSNYNDRHPVCMLASLIWIFLISFFLFGWFLILHIQFNSLFTQNQVNCWYMRFILKKEIYFLKSHKNRQWSQERVYIMKNMQVYSRLKRFKKKHTSF